MSKKWIPILCVDFDGVLHKYTSGWQGAGTIPDPPVEGAIEWLVNAVLSEEKDDEGNLKSKVQIAIYSSRSKDEEGIPAMRRWLATHLTEYFKSLADSLRNAFFKAHPKLEEMVKKDPNPEIVSALADEQAMVLANLVLDKIQFPTQKPAAIMTIDDRAHCFMGKFRPLDWYLNFKPWNKRSDEPNVPDYDKNWSQEDEDLSDQALECLLDCLTVDRDGFLMFEGSALEYMASQFREARLNATKDALKMQPEYVRETLRGTLSSSRCNSKCLDDDDDREAVLEEIMRMFSAHKVLSQETNPALIPEDKMAGLRDLLLETLRERCASRHLGNDMERSAVVGEIIHALTRANGI